jgi:hypothetical protein
MKNGRKKRPARSGKKAARNGRAPSLAELFAGLYADPAAPPPDPADAPGGDKAGLLAALASGELLSGGADNLQRLAAGIAAGAFDDPAEVTDQGRREIIDHVNARLKSGAPAEKVAALAALNAITARPGCRPRRDEAAPNDRDRAGKFLRGNRCSLGNASSRKMAQLRGAFLEDIDGPKLRQLAAKLFSMAVSGDLEAAKLILFYALGKPRECPDADRLDLDEWRLLRESPTPAQVWFTVDQGCDPSFGVELWRRNSAAGPEALFQQIRRVTDSSPLRFAQSQLDEARAKTGR